MSCMIWGRGIDLGLKPPEGINVNKWCIMQPKAMEGLSEERIVDCACGEGHTLLVTEDGDVISFGRNREHQLGRPSDGLESSGPGRVQGLKEEVCKSVAAGAFHSVVVTMSGRLYEFGLVAAGNSQEEGGGEQERTTTAGAAPARELRGSHREGTVLRRIVQESTERWYLASDLGLDDEIAATEDDAQLLARTRVMSPEERRAAVGLARMDAQRTKLIIPRLATSLSHVRVDEVVCGYGHSLARSTNGQVYASGYNDCGQLGLGHRCNSGIFQHVDAFAKTHVIQVAAGAQHSLAIVQVEYNHKALFVWGQGSLGQLGLGRRVTGRLRPVSVPINQEIVSTQPIACAAGANHSVVLDADGVAYGFGHAEYFQLGSTSTSASDLFRAGYYYSSRRIEPVPDRPLVSIACGANFTLAVADDGSLVSWGWPSHGVLGRGASFASSIPTPHAVEGLDGSRGTPEVLKCSAGTRHAVAIARDARDPYALRFRKLLIDSSLGFDVEIKVDGDENGVVKAHAAVLAARSRYFRGLLRYHLDTDSDTLILPDKIGGVAVSIAMIRALVHYLYTDRVEAPPHRLRALSKLGRYLCMDLFADLCDPEIQHAGLASTFAIDMAQFVADPFAADLLLRLHGGFELSGHRAILAGNSEFFDALIHFETQRRNQDDNEKKSEEKTEAYCVIDLFDWGGPESLITRPVALAVLKFLYSGAICVDDEVSPFDLIVAADLIRVHPLVLACERFLVELIAKNPDYAQTCLDFANRFEFCSRLRRAAIDVLSTVNDGSATEYKCN